MIFVVLIKGYSMPQRYPKGTFIFKVLARKAHRVYLAKLLIFKKTVIGIKSLIYNDIYQKWLFSVSL